MENSKVKALFFYNYYGQKVAWCKNSAGDFQLFRLLSNTLVDEVEYIILRTVDQLTDEEYINIAKIIYPNAPNLHEIHVAKEQLKFIFKQHQFQWPMIYSLMVADYLRSITILLPFTFIDENGKPQTLQPDEIIAKGWAKVNHLDK